MGNFTAAETERCPSLTEEIEGFHLYLRVPSILLDSRDRNNTFFSKSPQGNLREKSTVVDSVV